MFPFSFPVFHFVFAFSNGQPRTYSANWKKNIKEVINRLIIIFLCGKIVRPMRCIGTRDPGGHPLHSSGFQSRTEHVPHSAISASPHLETRNREKLALVTCKTFKNTKRASHSFWYSCFPFFIAELLESTDIPFRSI